MKYRHLAIPVALATAGAVTLFAPLAQAQMPRPMSSQAVNDRAVVMGILAAEFSLQQGDVASAAATYYEVAKRTQDAKVAERAVDLLVRTRRVNDAKEIAALWQVADPDAIRPLQIALALALTSQDETRAQQAVTRVLSLPEEKRAEAVMDVARQLAQYRDRDAAVKLASVFTERLPKLPESYYALSVASTGNNNARINESMLAIDRALALRPDWPQAVAVKSRLLLARSAAGKEGAADRAAAMSVLEKAIAAAPDSRELRVLAARTEFDLENFAEARKRFLALADEGKEDAEEMRLAAALSAYHAKDWVTADREFSEALEADRGDPAAVRYYLGRISESQKRWAEAVERYSQVPPSERYWESQLRVANALAQDKQMLQAVAHLRALKPGNALERLSLAQTESALWRDAGENVKAFEALDAALVVDSEDADLLYESAMLAERIDRMDEAEKRLRKVIALQPKRAHAYNALGYSFADRNINLDEARTLIEKAHELAPDDAAILDSMGWIAFRQGRLEDAAAYLKRAFDKFQDGEIAAHLGEVLWALGRKDEARGIWQTQLKAQPDSDILKKTMARLER
ncbi:tetratricopeptide repeat protein [Casimicrobium huifangae]|uniref:tetratricopeptide repeat protein n=1 Tax=Casimicrobium huifangae TaxID=2591109 RepID=UPI0013967846|nr:tetratricopeptide repeat protein [Casimicrobium huifangae]